MDLGTQHRTTAALLSRLGGFRFRVDHRGTHLVHATGDPSPPDE